eukprot:GHVR01062271.1.p2 GENE.GHVR01062271.1~~GHVR01062271.1.p2  ORF type:complete len:185 (-),score=109.05 GHVR01062271.1:477-1031(-)
MINYYYFLNNNYIYNNNNTNNNTNNTNNNNNNNNNNIDIGNNKLNINKLNIKKYIKTSTPEYNNIIKEGINKLKILQTEVLPLIIKLKNIPKDNNKVINYLNIKVNIILQYLTNISFYIYLKSKGCVNIKSHPVIQRIIFINDIIEQFNIIDKNIYKNIYNILSKNNNKSTDTHTHTHTHTHNR